MLYGWSEYSWDRLLADTAVGFPPTEDQITQELLSALAHRFGHLTAVWGQKRYSGSGEGGLHGPNADWDWWVADGAGWRGLRVQAKKIDPHTGYYDDLNNDSKKKAKQAALLITNAAVAGRGLVPAYCFYNAWFDPPPPAAGRMGTHRQRRSFGATLVRAGAVQAALNLRLPSARGRPRIGFNTFDGEHISLGRFFCQKATPRSSLAAWVRTGSPGAPPEDRDGVPTQLTPEIVQALLKTLSPNDDIAASGREQIAGLEASDVGARAVLVQVQDEAVLQESLSSIE